MASFPRLIVPEIGQVSTLYDLVLAHTFLEKPQLGIPLLPKLIKNP